MRELLDIWRGVVVLLLAINISMHMQFYLMRRRQEKTRGGRVADTVYAWGLLPGLLLMFYVTFDIVGRLGQGLTWRTPLATVAAIVGAISLRWLVRWPWSSE